MIDIMTLTYVLMIALGNIAVYAGTRIGLRKSWCKLKLGSEREEYSEQYDERFAFETNNDQTFSARNIYKQHATVSELPAYILTDTRTWKQKTPQIHNQQSQNFELLGALYTVKDKCIHCEKDLHTATVGKIDRFRFQCEPWPILCYILLPFYLLTLLMFSCSGGMIIWSKTFCNECGKEVKAKCC